ncbi:MAG TPA: hypothetical protein IAD10_07195 [Candidatus Fimicola cottocaccae]|nr:hypothetical protein [Candidatus Fimicola cottocaccae]
MESEFELKRRRNEINKSNPFKIIIVLILIILCIVFLIGKFGINVIDNLSRDPNRIDVIVKDKIVPDELSIYIVDNEKYFSVDFLKEYIDDTVFPEADDNTLTITNENSVIRLSTDELTYYVNSEPLSLEMPIITKDEVMLIPCNLTASLYNLNIEYIDDEKTAVIDFYGEEISTSVLQKNVKMYSESDIKSHTVTRVKKGSEITIFGNENGFYKVRFNEYVGYIEEKYITDIVKTNFVNNEENYVSSGFTPENGKITMVWDQVFNVSQNKNDSKFTAIENLDVISPTWFAISDNEGNVSNIADKSYVDWAHSQGYQVWGLLSNSFDPDITHNTLSSPEIREEIIKQVLAYAELYELDGINIDFETIRSDDGEYFVQFVREITPYLKAQGLTVSVDLSRPEGWNYYYGMEEIGETVDYVVLMAYDEHWGTSPESGSVASMGWTEESITSTLDMVSPEKVILGIPFYTRLWEEKNVDGNLTVSSSSLGMQAALNYINENNMEIVYDEESGQNYSSIEKDGATYKIWLEDELSLRKRMELVEKYNLAGCAGWKRHLETDNTWSIINSYMKN